MNMSVPARPAAPVALLADGENIAKGHIAVLNRAARDHAAQLRRVYGAAEHLAGWDDQGFRPCPTRPGKNAADLLLCVDAMELALREGYGTLLIATSDRDFTYLAERLRELGKRVIGLGEEKAPKAFRAACSEFVLLTAQRATVTTEATGSPPEPATKLIPLVRKVLVEATAEGGWSTAQWIGTRLKLADPEFDRHRYGSGSLETLLRGVSYFHESRSEKGTRLFRDPNPLSPPPLPHNAP